MKSCASIVILAAMLMASMPTPAQVRAAAPAPSPLAGTWTLNREMSDSRDDLPGPGAGRRGDGEGRRGGFGRGRGGFGGGGFGGGGGGDRGRGGDRAEMQRQRDAVRDLLSPADRLTIVQTDTMVIITTGDGRTTRLSPDNKSIKDDNTGIERKTKWDNGKLASEISGIGRGKITETYSVGADDRRLHRTVTMPDMRGDSQPRTLAYVYDLGNPR